MLKRGAGTTAPVMTVRQALGRSLRLLSHRDRRFLALAAALQTATSFLDLIGVLLIGLLAAVAVTTSQSQPLPSIVQNLANWVGLSELNSTSLVVALAAVAAFVLLFKSVASSLITRRVFIFLANRQALVCGRLVNELLRRPLTFVQKRSTQETAYALIQGTATATLGMLGQAMVLVTETSLLIVVGVALLIIDPLITLGAILFFGAIALLLQRAMGGWASRMGNAAGRADVKSLDAIQEALRAYREITVSSRQDFYVDRIAEWRWEAARVAANFQLMTMFPKYMFEAAMVVGGFALSAVLFTTQDAVAAVGSLALYIAAASRVMPSLMRLQGAALILRGSAGVASETFQLADDLGRPVTDPGGRTSRLAQKVSRHAIPDASIRLERVSYTYPGAQAPAVRDISLDVPFGTTLALAGATGAGKSTLADIILGVLIPDEGRATVGGVAAVDAPGIWPGAIAYVPQEIVIANGDFRENVALGVPPDQIDDVQVLRALDQAHLLGVVESTSAGIYEPVGESGKLLSGGQRQRLGIARALYSSPQILVMDEATSALDAVTEKEVSDALRSLEGYITQVIVAHRLSTIRHAEQVLYLDGGEIVARGTFAELVARVPAFHRQAQLMGLS